MSVRVLIADDQAMVRAGLRMILEQEPDIDVVGEADDGDRAVAIAHRTQPDVLIMDIRMPRLDGVSATRRILAELHEPPAILILTTFDDDQSLFDALRAGAAGFLLKNAPPEQLVDAVRIVAGGEGLLSTAVTRRVLAEIARHPTPTSPDRLETLTPREIDVLKLIAAGLSNTEIADRLTISHGTAKSHVARILMKLQLRHRAEAVVIAFDTGLVRPGER